MRIAARALGGALLISFLISALFMAGRSYLWCVPMQRVMYVSCCDAGQGVEPRVRTACCETRDVLSLPQAEARGTGSPVIPPALAAIAAIVAPQPALLPPRRAPLTSPVDRSARERPIRAGPVSPSQHLAFLQVFRC